MPLFSPRRLLFGAAATALVVMLSAAMLTIPARSAAGQPTPVVACSSERSGNGSSVVVTFTPASNDGAFRYIVERRRDQSGWFWAGKVDAPGTSFREGNLNSSATYDYRVRSRASGGVNSASVNCPAAGAGLPAAPTAVTANAAGRARLEPAGTGVLMGVYVDTGGRSNDAVRRQEIVDFQNNVAGRPLDIAQIFSAANDQAWKVDRANWMLSNDQIPLITWKPGPRTGAVAGNGEGQKILDGVYDADIRARAAEAKRINGPFFSRLFHEMDGGVGDPYDFTPEQFVRIWRHIHGIFERQGVANAVWTWTPAIFSRNNVDVARYYPGDAYVDWIGVDPYSWIGNSQGNTACSADASKYGPMTNKVGSKFWSFAAAHPDKPVMLGEWGAGYKDGSDVRERFIRSVGEMLVARPQVKALVYFNHNADPHCVWRLDQGPSAGREAFRQLVNNSRWAVDTGSLIRANR